MIYKNPIELIKSTKIFRKEFKESQYTVVYIHGYVSNHRGFDRIAKDLEEKHISYFTFDLPSHGDAPKWSYSKMTISCYVDFCEDIIRYHGVKKIILVGHSMGGGIVSLLLERIPELVSKLVLIDPLNITIYSQAKNFIGFLNKSIATKTNQIVSSFFQNEEEYKKNYVEEYDYIVTKPFQTFMNNKLGFLKLGATLFQLTMLKKIDNILKDTLKPIYLIMGEFDRWFDCEKTINWLKNLNPNARCYIVKNTGHAPYLEDHDEFMEYFWKIIENR